MFERRQRGLKRKGGSGGNRRRGPGWGHGHTCLGLLVIYCPELWRQSAEFKEICNEKFLIPSLKAFVKPCLLPPSLRHAINTFIRQIKSLDMAMSSGSKLLVANINVFSLEAMDPCSSRGTCCILENKHAEHNSGSLVAKKSALSSPNVDVNLQAKLMADRECLLDKNKMWATGQGQVLWIIFWHCFWFGCLLWFMWFGLPDYKSPTDD